MFPSSGDNFTIPYDLDPVGNDAWAIVGGHFDVQLSPIVLEGGGHFDVSHPVLEAVDFGFVGVYSSSELVDVAVGFGKILVGGCCLLVYCGDEPIGDGVRSVLEVATLIYVEYCFGQSGGDWWAVPHGVRGDVDVKWGW